MFKPRILTRFLIGRFFSGVGIVVLVICGIIFAITFIERLPMNDTMYLAILDAWARLLGYIPMFLPLATFMGTLFASYRLTKSTESIIVSSAGMSPFDAARPFLIGAFLLGICTTCFINPYAVGLSTEKITSENLKLIDNAIWLRESGVSGTITIRAEDVRIKNDELFFTNAIIWSQTPDFKLIQRIESDYIKLSNNGISVKYAKIWDKNATAHFGSWERPTLLNPKTVLDRYLQPGQISFWQLPEFIQKMEKIGAPVRTHLVQFWSLFFMPLTMISMAVLGVAFSQTRQRRNYSFGIKFGIGIIACFVLYFLTSLFNTLGSTGTLPPLLSVIAPPLIIIAAAGIFITSFDNA